MFIQASNEYHIDLTKSLYIGDTKTDLSVGNEIGCKTIIIDNDDDLLQIAKELTNNKV
jgi:histidinol phosphatase-like enzyme